MGMIGTSCGAKNNKSTGSSKNIDSRKDAKLTISEDGASYAEKIC